MRRRAFCQESPDRPQQRRYAAMTAPKVSVIIPVYNTEPYLRRCLDSVCGQTLRDIEIICVNDASPDKSGEILREYAGRDERIRLIEFEENRGVSAARNAGLDAAQGEYVGFVDSDDYVDMDFYFVLYSEAKKTASKIAKGGMKLKDEKTGALLESQLYSINEKILKNKSYFYNSFTTAIYDRNFIKSNNINFPDGISMLEDTVFAIKLNILSKKITINNNCFYHYVRRDTSLTLNKYTVKYAEDTCNAVEIILNFLNSSDIDAYDYAIIFYHIIKNFMKVSISIHDTCIKSDETRKILSKGLVYALEKCMYSQECWQRYFVERAEEQKYEKMKQKHLEEQLKHEEEQEKSEMCQIARYRRLGPDSLNREYANFQNLTSDGKTRLKILVSYIKPSYLFKNSVLTPIHLGRAVAKEPSKDGIISDIDYQYLVDNMCGDDDFIGNISHLNRRIGFLTGTYWAWKNYKRLGDPKYFGSFGYRRLFEHKFLSKLEIYDAIFPQKRSFYKAGWDIRKQFNLCHFQEVYNYTIKVIQKLYSVEVEYVKEYFSYKEGYFYEIYILSKRLFFEFCSWIFPIMFKLIERKFEPIINNNFRQKRDIGFIAERLTGYYLWRLSMRKDINYTTAKVIVLN
jgi:glycosyltransferase involved in cell wall biosynthesis